MPDSLPSALLFSELLPSEAAYAALFETTGWNTMYRRTPAQLAAALRESWYLQTAYRGDALVGAGRLVSDGVLYAVVFDLIVFPEWRGRGVGSAILHRLLDHAAEAGIPDVLLFAARGTEPFYQRHGFVPRPTEAPGMIARLTR